jgi:ABC-type bacteriocin/lantibiotic exporter with double-glycine peptidase domain
MERLMKGRTTFMIAHRLTTLMSCDLLLVIENGRLITKTWDVSAAIKNALSMGEFETINLVGRGADTHAKGW